MLRITIILLLGCTMVHLKAQNLFTEVQMGEEIHGDWVADWSLENEKEDQDKDYSVYRYDENDTLYIIRNEKIAYRFPYGFHEYSDTVYYSTRESIMNIQSKEHFEAMRPNFDVFKFKQDSFILLRGHNRIKNVFYKSKSQTIPESEYAKELKGNKYSMIGTYKCGMVSSHTVYDFHFVSDSTCVISKRLVTTAPERKEELLSVDTLGFEVIGDILQFKDKTEYSFFKSEMQIKQRIGVTKNRLLIQGLKEEKE